MIPEKKRSPLHPIGPGLVLVAIGALVAFLLHQWSFSQSSVESPSHLTSPLPAPTLQYQVHPFPNSTIHTLTIPVQGPFVVVPALAPSVEPLEHFADQNGAIAVLNGGFFDPVNQKTTSYVVIDGAISADPRQNERLVQNPNLASYLDRILNRTEFRQYSCNGTLRYDMAFHAEPIPDDCELVSALGGGPRLLPDLTATQEGFLEMVDGQVIRDALGMAQPNARTAIALTATGDVIWVMAAQTTDPSSGVSLRELASFLQSLGAEQAMNLDGGSSSSLYYDGQTIFGKVDATGNPVQRPVKSVLLVQERSDRP